MPPNAMDVEPIYCAEQIVVPPDLADVLKAFTKEVIRRQPADLLEFSASYFAELAAVQQVAGGAQPPDVQQLQALYQQLRDVDAIATVDFVNVCKQAGIEPAAVAAAASDAADGLLRPADAIAVMVSMTAMSTEDCTNGLFAVFGEGGMMPKERLMPLLQVVLPPDALDTLQQLAEELGDMVTAEDLAGRL